MFSKSAIHCIVRCLGAPVIEPQGNVARSTSASAISGRRRACTVEVIWNTVLYGSMANSSGTLTESIRT